MDINPFILTQIGDKQNELILSTYSIDKAVLTDYIYSFYDELKDKDSFFRSFKMNEYIIAAYYWKTNIPEVGSGRLGLYVVIGFVITNNSNSADGLVDSFIFYSSHFFKILEDAFNISLSSSQSDTFYNAIQTKTEEKMNYVANRFINLKTTFPKARIRYNRPIFNTDNKKQIKISTIKYIYMLNDHPNFYESWMAFGRESLSLLKTKDMWDISTLKEYTPQTIVILENGNKIPTIVSKSDIIQYQNCKYMLLT